MEEGRKEDSTHRDVVREGKKEDTWKTWKAGRRTTHTHKIPSGKERRRAYMENMEDRK